MKKLTKKQKEKLAHEILVFLTAYGLNNNVRIYFADKCLTGEDKIIYNIRGSDYFEYANDDTLSMSFEGDFYEIINYCNPKMADIIIPKFSALLESYGLYYELGDAWNLATYYRNEKLAKPVPEIKKGESEKNPIYISYDNCPREIEYIRAEWKRRQNEYGDVGSCVIGAGFTFKYKKIYYRMPPQGNTQGSISWEASKDAIQDMLNNAGCENIQYHWGCMD